MRKFILILLTLLCVTCIDHVEAQVNKHYFVWVGRDMVMESRYEEAIETLNILLKADPDAYEGYFWRGIAKYHLDDLLGAERDFTTTLEKNQVYTTAYQFRAITRSRMGNYPDALNDFQEAISLRPDYLAPYYSRGVVYMLTRQYEKAVTDLNMYIRFNQRDADAYANRGVAHLNLRDTTAAHEDFERAIRTNRNYPRGYMERGGLRMQQGDYEQALVDFNTAIKCDSTYAPAYFSRAIVHHKQKNLTAALHDFDQVLAIDPTNSVTYFNRALLRTEIGDYNRALEDYDKVAIYSPGNVLVYYNRAGLYNKLGEFKKALRDYDSAIELFPDFANAYLNRSGVKQMLRDSNGAAKDLRTAEKKIEEYRSKLENGIADSFADTTRQFNALLSFDARMSNAPARSSVLSDKEKIILRPLYGFTLRTPDTDELQGSDRHKNRRVNDFLALFDNKMIVFSCGGTNIPAGELVALDSRVSELIMKSGPQWELYFQRGITQSLLRQYTNAANSLSAAIEIEPSNPFLYLNRSTILAEMTDFISSMDNEYARISVEGNRTTGGRNASTTRTYNYDEAIADLNKAAKLYPDFAYIYYNRGNLLALSGKFEEAFVDYSRAIALNPELAEAYFNRGLVQIYMEKMRNGLLDMSKAGEMGITEAYTVLKLYANELENPKDNGSN